MIRYSEGYIKSKMRRWSDKEKNYLKQNYNVLPMWEIIETLNRSHSSIVSQINYLRARGWTFKRKRDE